MRIISGNLKGKKILSPKNELTRPLKDLTKESIFNLIKHSKLLDCKLENANILDLFAGVGSFGLECLSRGAQSVTFFENYKEALIILKENISRMKQQNFSEVIEKNIFLENTFKYLNKKYDIIFMDPPYKEKNLSKIIKDIFEAKIIKDNGIIIIHRHKKDKDEFPKVFRIIEEKTYGISRVFFGSYTY